MRKLHSLRNLALIGILAALVAGPHCSGEAGTQQPSYVVFQLDNDIFSGTDRDYTNGARLAWMGPVAGEALNDIQRILKRFSGAGKYPLMGRLSDAIGDDEIAYEWGYGITQLMFTPEDEAADTAPAGQRPYAGWLGVETSLHAKTHNSVSSVVFLIGIAGEHSLAEETQEFVHKYISDSPIFQGWDSQIPSELTLNILLERKIRYSAIAEPTRSWDIQFDGFFEYGAALGNGLTGGHIGTLFRAGYNLPDQFMIPRLEVGNYSHEPFNFDNDLWSSLSIYGYLGGRGKWVLHNITLDGPVFRDYDSPVSSEPLVGEILFGVGVRYKSVTLAMSKTFSSEEFNTQDSGHQYGSIMLSLAY